jgi:hypothetical protein
MVSQFELCIEEEQDIRRIKGINRSLDRPNSDISHHNYKHNLLC